MTSLETQRGSDIGPQVQPPHTFRSKVHIDGERVVLSIPARFDVGILAGAALIWGIGLLCVVNAWPTGVMSGGLISRLVNVALGILPSGWAMPALVAGFTLLSVVLGCVMIFAFFRFETATLDGSSLTLRTAILGIVFEEKSYAATSVTALRVASSADHRAASFLTSAGWDDEGTLAFDYGSETIVFGACLPVAEAHRVLPALKGALPAGA